MHGHMNVNLSRCTVTWTSIYHDARSPERQFITMHGHLNVKLSRCTVTWTSIYYDARSPERQIITMHGHLNVKLSRCRSPERQIITMHGHLNVKFSRCTVTWTSNYHDARSPERQIITMHGHLNVKCFLKESSSSASYKTVSNTSLLHVPPVSPAPPKLSDISLISFTTLQTSRYPVARAVHCVFRPSLTSCFCVWIIKIFFIKNKNLNWCE